MKNPNYKKITSIAAALKATKVKKLPTFKEVRAKDRKYMAGAYIISLASEAINGKWIPDYSDSQWKYRCWFGWNPGLSAFVFDDTHIAYANTCTYGGSRLDFETREQAEHFGKYFIKPINDFLKK